MKKSEYRPFKKHFWIPFILNLCIIAAGIVMTITNQTDKGSARGKSGSGFEFVLTGPSVIGLGLVVVAILIWSRKSMK